MKKIVLAGLFCVATVGQVAHAAKVCGKISWRQAWDGGVFSVIDSSGMTVASTQLVYSGGMGCTNTFDDGLYVIRFNGFLEKTVSPFDGVWGCVTQAYQIVGSDPFVVVFDQGRPPFNGGEMCSPAK